MFITLCEDFAAGVSDKVSGGLGVAWFWHCPEAPRGRRCAVFVLASVPVNSVELHCCYPRQCSVCRLEQCMIRRNVRHLQMFVAGGCDRATHVPEYTERRRPSNIDARYAGGMYDMRR